VYSCLLLLGPLLIFLGPIPPPIGHKVFIICGGCTGQAGGLQGQVAQARGQELAGRLQGLVGQAGGPQRLTGVLHGLAEDVGQGGGLQGLAGGLQGLAVGHQGLTGGLQGLAGQGEGLDGHAGQARELHVMAGQVGVESPPPWPGQLHHNC